MKRILALLIVAVAVAPTAAFAGGPSNDVTKSAQADCTSLRAKIGATAFTTAYSTFGACVSKYAPVEQQSVNSANDTCTAQQAEASFASSHGGKTFDQFYGTRKNTNNAFGNCVSTLAKASSQAERQNRMNPAQTCRGSQKQMGSAAFTALYRTFGKCVSAVARAQSQNEQSASTACRTEQVAGQAAFDQKYASFGACVSGQAKAASASQQQATVNASKQCYAQLKADGAGFKTKYATFGKCVSKLAQS
jgi:hypothetical protein